jgi:hypothetical protein
MIRIGSHHPVLLTSVAPANRSHLRCAPCPLWACTQRVFRALLASFPTSAVVTMTGRIPSLAMGHPTSLIFGGLRERPKVQVTLQPDFVQPEF